MSITPQAIKDQEFQLKFRGYDAIEVKAYLELLAEEFFELHEARRNLEQDAVTHVEEEVGKKDEVIAGLGQKIEKLEKAVDDGVKERERLQDGWREREKELEKSIEELQAELELGQENTDRLEVQASEMRSQVKQLEKEIGELKKEEVDFKATLLAAQKFAEDTRIKAEEEAEQLVEVAREEVEAVHQKAVEELGDLPLQISELKMQKAEVRKEVRGVLLRYLEQFTDPGDEQDVASELFQKIDLGEDADLVAELSDDEAGS